MLPGAYRLLALLLHEMFAVLPGLQGRVYPGERANLYHPLWAALSICCTTPLSNAGASNTVLPSYIPLTTSSWGLPFEPADAKRSTKCVAGSHSKVVAGIICSS